MTKGSSKCRIADEGRQRLDKLSPCAIQCAMMLLFFILLYALLCTVHLACCALEKETLRAITKCLLMPLLAVCAVSYALRGTQESHVVILIALALACGTAGDALLLIPSDGAFVAGASCFLAGHVAWILTMRKALAACPIKGIVAWAIVSTLLLFFLWRILHLPRGIMGAGVVIYGLLLTALAGTGIAAVHRSCAPQAIMFLSGGVLFFISDGVLAYDRFAARIAHSNLIIMITYIAAQTLLAFSSAMST